MCVCGGGLDQCGQTTHLISILCCLFTAALLSSLLLLSSARRVYLERGLFLPGVVLSLLPHAAGGALLRYLLLLQDQRSVGSLPGEPGPQGLHTAGAQL